MTVAQTETLPDASVVTDDEDGATDKAAAMEKRNGPMPAMLPTPASVANAAEAVGKDSFFLAHGLVDAWFLRRSDVLLVSFDNLASIDEYEPPQPWLQARAAKAGFSILGLLASRRDWYRNEDAPALIAELRDAGVRFRCRNGRRADHQCGGGCCRFFQHGVQQ